MKKVILMSIRPYWLEKILNGEKTIEIRKSMPKCDLPIDVYLYCTKSIDLFFDGKKPSGKVVAKFTLNFVEPIPYIENELDFGRKENYYDISPDVLNKSCMTFYEISEYGKGKELYGWYIDDLEIFDNPMELSDFYHSKRCKDYVQDYANGCDDVCGCYENGCCKNGYNHIVKAPKNWCYAYVGGKKNERN